MRTPIHQILGYAEMLEEDAFASGQTGWVDDLGKIQAAARRLLEMVDGLPERLLIAPGEGTAEAREKEPAATTGMDSVPDPTEAGAGDDPAKATGPIRRADFEIAATEPVEPAHILVVDDNEVEPRDALAAPSLPRLHDRRRRKRPHRRCGSSRRLPSTSSSSTSSCPG